MQKLIFLGAGGSCIQSIEHPGCVWDVTFLPNGDLVTACSDGVARVWTRDSQHSASLEELEAYKSLILTRKMQTWALSSFPRCPLWFNMTITLFYCL